MRRPHLVPLSRQALAVLDELWKRRKNDVWVFPGERSCPYIVQEGVGIALFPEGVCRNGVQDVRVMPIQDLKPLELVLVYRSNCSPIAERIAIGIGGPLYFDAGLALRMV